MIVAQAIHAAGESSPGGLGTGTHAIALEARDSDHLDGISRRLSELGVAHVRIVEDDRPYRGQLLAIGVVPGPKSVVGRHLSSLPLVRERPPAEADREPMTEQHDNMTRKSPSRGFLGRLQALFRGRD